MLVRRVCLPSSLLGCFGPRAPGGTEIAAAAAGLQSELVAGKLTSRTTWGAVDCVLVRTADDNKQEGTI